MALLAKDRPSLVGILNFTPDSFSDGGRHATHQSAIDAGLRMLDEGADILDIGGESTRPGATPVNAVDELSRVLPLVEALAGRGAVVSVDTMKASVAKMALQSGATIVNDVSAMRDPDMAQVCVEAGAYLCLTHMQGTPETMQLNPTYLDVVTDVRQFLLSSAQTAIAAGVAPDRIWIDPGIGFGKTDEHNRRLLRNIGSLVDLGFPVLLGVSRKAFIGRTLQSNGHSLGVHERLEGSLAIQVLAQVAGVKLIRSHDVQASRRAIDMTAAIINSKLPGTKPPQDAF